MVFSSSTFLFYFLPLTLLVYFILPTRGLKNYALLATSLVFYAWGEPVYVLLMIFSIFMNWALAILISRSKRLFMTLAVLINLAILGFFKYEGFVAQNINAIFGFEFIPNLNLSLPIGISFFTLQALSYVIDVYRGEVEAQKNPFYLGMYIAMFPQLIAGPIVRYQDIELQIKERHENLKDFADGLRLFIVGLSKKVLLSNIVAILASKMLSSGGEQIGIIGSWGGLIAYSFQIFFDFSGYSDMAIGLGRMFGFKYLRNFNYPYISKSATEFWRRWHISLGSFFRDYVYIPLGGNRVSKKRWVFNIFVVWSLTGIWHGAAWNFVLWGLYWGILIALEKIFLNRFLQAIPKILSHLYAIAIILFGWLIFWIEDPSKFVTYLSAMFGSFGLTGTSKFWELTVWEYWPVFLICALASTPIIPFLRERLACWLQNKKFNLTQFLECDIPGVKTLNTKHLCTFDLNVNLKSKQSVYQVISILLDIALLCLLVISIIFVVSGSFNPFIYFRF